MTATAPLTAVQLDRAAAAADKTIWIDGVGLIGDLGRGVLFSAARPGLATGDHAAAVDAVLDALYPRHPSYRPETVDAVRRDAETAVAWLVEQATATP